MPHICWEAAETGNPLDSIICRLFVMRLVRWMFGVGHPRLMLEDGHITAEIYEHDRRDQGLRARLFYKNVCGSSLRLIGYGEDHIQVSD